jgi:hypothetical protein
MLFLMPKCNGVVANRLPITVQRNEDGSYDLKTSARGPVLSLSGVMKRTEPNGTLAWHRRPTRRHESDPPAVQGRAQGHLGLCAANDWLVVDGGDPDICVGWGG